MTQLTTATAAPGKNDLLTNLKPLAIDVAVPLGSYYLLKDGFGLGIVLSLGLSGVVPAVRTVAGIVRDRSFNGLAGLMVVVNVAGMVLSFVTGDPRLMLAKNSGVSSVVAFSILVSVFAGRPLMSAGLKPFLTKGDAPKIAAWDRLSAQSARFVRFERLYSAIWGVALLAECTARLVGTFTLPIATMAGLSTAFLIGAIAIGVVAGGIAAKPLEEMIEAEIGA
jgi:hypothetical protein